MKRLFCVGLAFCATLLLLGCVTQYQKQGATGGYTETQLDENIWKVTFKGNGFTQPERASDFALLRSAELAKENGYSYFIIIDSIERTKNSTHTTPTSSVTNANATVVGNNVYGNARTTNYGGDTMHISKPSTTNTIVCYREKPVVDGIVYSADFIINSIRSKYPKEQQ